MSFIEGPYPLLEAQAPPYTNATVRRAFIVWMHCGQRNCFKDVCNYYHYLESLEDKLPADSRATSRHHEFNMFSNPPPTSPYLNQIFPKLYSQNHTLQHYIKNVEIKQDSILDLTDTDAQQNGVSTGDILDTSHMIKKYCKSRMITLKKFLTEFKEYARKCELNYTVNNVAFYIKRKMVEEELLMVENYSKSLNFLNFNGEKEFEKPKIEKNVGTRMSEEQLKFFSSINAQKHITILTRDRRDFLNQYWNNLTRDMTFRNVSTRAW